MPSDKILLEGIRCLVSVGVDEKEREQKQECLIDLEIVLDVEEAARTEDLSKTLNYAEVLHQVVRLVENRSFLLIEKMAEEIAGVVLKFDPVRKVKVRVKKMKPPIPETLSFAAVEIKRTKKTRRSKIPPNK